MARSRAIVFSALVLLLLSSCKCNAQDQEEDEIIEDDTCEKDSEGNCLPEDTDEEGESKYKGPDYGPHLNPKQYVKLTQRNASKVMYST